MNRYIGSNNFKEHVRSTLSPCGSFMFSGSEDGLVHVWDTETGKHLLANESSKKLCAPLTMEMIVK